MIIRLILAADRVLTGLAVLTAMIALALAVLLGFWQVVARFVLAQPSPWTEVAIQLLIAWMVFLGAAGAFRTGAAVSVDLARRALKGRARLVLDVVIAAASTGFLVLVVWQGWIVVRRVRFQNLAGLDIPVSYAYAALPVGAAFCMIAVLARLLDPESRREETDPSLETQV
ncbi:TRAP transporter small permease [Tistrella mobilis]|uniref:TRAP transporter small permease protein n=1 Tax=Tistrella mobilis (strain KA081020-065) TaxID=1110502 RepID=I3TGU7_TISMK|nr:TRAP transporter small permease [Tistrella mobilis]AFK51985.1 tripartite ATP-independent periplasmic transporter DctQ [Tistrella mobilis KA081020-065]MAM76799.1 TRAP transporter small permease [Tistrella sp.]